MAFGHAKLAIKNDRTRQADDDLANRTAEKYNWAGRPTTATEMVTIGLSDFSVGRFFGLCFVLAESINVRVKDSLVWGRTQRVLVNGG